MQISILLISILVLTMINIFFVECRYSLFKIDEKVLENIEEKNKLSVSRCKKIKSKEKEYSLLINKEENYRFLEICRNIVLVNKNSKIVFIIPERAFKDITEKEQFLNEIKLKIEIWQKRNLFKLRFLFCVFEIV